MQEIPVSRFKATCLAVIETVRRTGAPVRLTKFGKPVAELVPTRASRQKRVLGGMRGTMEICGDIVGPICSVDEWTVDEP